LRRETPNRPGWEDKMTERPIIFNGEMVRAILAGRKTQTRRLIKPQPLFREHTFWNSKNNIWFGVDETTKTRGDNFRCPYGQPGDRLWVKETFAKYQTVQYIKRPDGRAFDEIGDGQVVYKADGFGPIDATKEHIRLVCDSKDVFIDGDRWKPSILMPRWASRINLEITNVRVERVQDISVDDAVLEGIEPLQGGARVEFMNLWDSINAKRGYGWKKNPWVWVVSFVVISNVSGRNE
jgi:hypothetical protein